MFFKSKKFLNIGINAATGQIKFIDTAKDGFEGTFKMMYKYSDTVFKFGKPFTYKQRS